MIHTYSLTDSDKGVRYTQCSWSSHRNRRSHMALQICHRPSSSPTETIPLQLPPRNKHRCFRSSRAPRALRNHHSSRNHHSQTRNPLHQRAHHAPNPQPKRLHLPPHRTNVRTTPRIQIPPPQHPLLDLQLRSRLRLSHPTCRRLHFQGRTNDGRWLRTDPRWRSP